MFARRLIIPKVFIFLIILSSSAYAEKSVYIISSYYDSLVKPYLIDANHVTFQSTAVLKQGTLGAIALAAWPQKNLIFATYDYSPIITWASTNALVNLGEIDTGVPSPPGLAGIVVDTTKEKIYVAQRQRQYLSVYKWNDASGTIEPNGVYDLTPTRNLYGLALDEINGRLYVTDDTNSIRCYDTNSWQLDPNNSFGIPYRAVGIAVDPNRAIFIRDGLMRS
jgi:DNA-binding beta-propeller fold protein YncE